MRGSQIIYRFRSSKRSQNDAELGWTTYLESERVVEVVVVVVVSLLPPEVDPRVERDSSRTRRVIGRPAPSMCRSSTIDVSELSAKVYTKETISKVSIEA